MSGLHLTIMATNEDTVKRVKTALNKFSRGRGASIDLDYYDWDNGWANLVKIALYKSGPDISEIGNTWTSSFSSMNAIRPFSEREINVLGDGNIFLASSWKYGSLPGDERIWGIPWMADTRVVYYRRDILAQAGIDETTAFSAPEAFAETIARLQAHGVEIPLVLPTASNLEPLYLLATWMWGSGGHFITRDGTQVQFNQPQALEGLNKYFKLHRYLIPSVQGLNDNDGILLFREGKVAVIISGQWVLHLIKQGNAAPEVAENLGVALVPGIPFVGGTDLIVWDHSHYSNLTIPLLRYLTSKEFHLEVSIPSGLLPARLDALNVPFFTEDPHYQVISQSLQSGRGFNATYMWGLVEEKLAISVAQIWKTLFDNPDLDVTEVTADKLNKLAKRLNATLLTRSGGR